VKSIVTYDGELDYAFPPQSVTLTLEDEIDVSRGEMLVHPDNLPIVDRNFEAMMVWMDEEHIFHFHPVDNHTYGRGIIRNRIDQDKRTARFILFKIVLYQADYQFEPYPHRRDQI